MLTRCRVFRWLLATELLLEGGAEAAPVQPNQLQAVSLRPARALPLRLDQPLVRRPCLHRQICGAAGAHVSIGPFCRYGKTFPGRSARETSAARLSFRAAPHGAVRPRPFSLLCLLGLLAHGCHPMLAVRLGAGFRPGLQCQIAPRSRPLIPTTARYCCCRPDASPGEDHETSSVMP
jgi:hypothetical protein